MLSVIDQHWREHLYEMDYLQEGINLRAMGQKDPLSEWQREGFDMFEAMMGTTDEEFVRYVFHVQVIVDEAPQADVRNVQYSAAEDPVAGTESIRSAAVAELPGGRGRQCGGPGRGDGSFERPTPRSSRCASRRRRAATNRAGAARARSSSSATAASHCA